MSRYIWSGYWIDGKPFTITYIATSNKIASSNLFMMFQYFKRDVIPLYKKVKIMRDKLCDDIISTKNVTTGSKS